MTGGILGDIPPANSGFSHIHFKKGVLWAGSTSLYTSIDSGVNWTQLPNINLAGGRITEINFFDKLNGVVGATTGVFKTVNGGNTWTKILTASPCYGVQFGASSSAIVAACDNNGFYYSVDGGTTWTNYNPGTHSMLVLTYPDGTTYGFGGGVGIGKLVKTVNQGATWTIISTIDYDSWSLARDSDISTLYLVNEEGHVSTDARTNFIKSLNGGGAWQKTTTFVPLYYCGSISVATCAIYCQSISNGVLRSTDKGANWQSIGGPDNMIDTRLVCAIDNNIIIAADGAGNIWRTTNSGGAPITVTGSFSYISQVLKPTITTCQQDSVLVIVTAENACFPRDVVISSADLTGTGAKSFKINLPIPLMISAGTIDTILIDFNQLHITGPITAKLHLTGYLTDGTTQTPFDTMITVQITVTATGPSIQSNIQSLTFKTRTDCNTVNDSLIRLTNTGCDTLRIIDGPGNISPGFYCDSLKFPIVIPPDSTISIPIHFDPPKDGNYTASTQFIASQQGINQQLHVTLNGKSTTGKKQLIDYDTVVMFKPISVCDPSSDTLVSITNTSCDTIRIFSGPGTWRSEFTTDTLTYPIVIPPGGTFNFAAHFHASNTGSYLDSGVFIAGRDNFSTDPPIDITVYLRGTSTAGGAPSPVLNTQLSFATVSVCDSVRDSIVTFTNYGCDTLRILSGPGGLDPQFDVEGLTFPIIIPPDSSITIHIHFHASKIGTYQTKAIYQTQRSGSKPELVELTLTGKNGGISTGPIVQATSYLFDTISLCASGRDTSIAFTNNGCDTLKILSGPGNLGIGFSTDQLTYPIVIPPDSSITIVFHFTPVSAGNFTSYPHFITERNGQQNPLDLFLQGSAIAGGSIFSIVTPSLSFTPLSICSSDSLEIVYTNIGCDSIFVTPVGIAGDIDFSAPKGNESGIAAGDSIRIKVVLLPTQQGTRTAMYILRLRDRNGQTRDTQITITGLIIPGSKTLKLSDSTVAFGITTLCASPDTTITLYNRGCDTLWVTDLALTGTGFSIDAPTPFYILPGENQRIVVHTVLDTANKQSSSSGVITITSNSQDPLPPIILSRGYTYPKNYTVRLEMPIIRANGGDTIVVKVIADSLPTDITTITAAYQVANTDLLTYLYTISNNTVVATPTDITITGSPITSVNKVIAELYYKVFLTVDTTTVVSLSNAYFNPSDPAYENCIATVAAASGNGFTYEFVCGNRLVGSVLRGEVLRLLSISPNPTSGGVTISIESPNEQSSEIQVYDMLGKNVLTQRNELQKGMQSLSIDSKVLARGMYSVVLRSQFGSVTTTFVKE